MTNLIIVIILFTVGFYLFSARSNSKAIANYANSKKGNTNLDAEKIVDSLEVLGYFRYSTKSDIEELKKEVMDGLKEHQYLAAIYEDNEPYNSKDFRHYPLDGEDLYEQGGIVDKLQEMQLTFNKMNVKMVITNHFEEWDDKNNWLNHRIAINGNEYIIFKNFPGYGWGEAAQRFAEIINDQLELQGSKERLFLANGGNDGRAVFLTEEQFNLLDPILEGTNDRPLRVKDWCKAMQVEPMRL